MCIVKATAPSNQYIPHLTKRSNFFFGQLLFVLALLGVESTSEIFVRLPQQLIYGSTPQFVSARKANQVEHQS